MAENVAVNEYSHSAGLVELNHSFPLGNGGALSIRFVECFRSHIRINVQALIFLRYYSLLPKNDVASRLMCLTSTPAMPPKTPFAPSDSPVHLSVEAVFKSNSLRAPLSVKADGLTRTGISLLRSSGGQAYPDQEIYYQGFIVRVLLTDGILESLRFSWPNFDLTEANFALDDASLRTASKRSLPFVAEPND